MITRHKMTTRLIPGDLRLQKEGRRQGERRVLFIPTRRFRQRNRADRRIGVAERRGGALWHISKVA